MCGLVMLLSKKGKPAGQYAFDLYTKQKTRGQQGYGYLAIKGTELVKVGRAKSEASIKEQIHKEKADLILFHHRLPTSTKNTLGTTHPIFVSHQELEYDYYFAHNGVITNAKILKTQHEVLGYKYNTQFTEKTYAKYENGDIEEIGAGVEVFNDSESLAIELARFIEGKTRRVNTVGGAAFLGVSLIKGTNQVHRVYFGKNLGRSLNYLTNKKWFGVTSETGQDVKDMTLFTLNLETRELEEEELVIDDAKPVQTTPRAGYGIYNQNLALQPPREDRMGTVYAYARLENKRYTYDEAVDSGVPLAEFFTHQVGSIKFYIPSKFAGQYDTRKPDSKTLETLEEYCLKLADLELQMDNIVEEQRNTQSIYEVDMETGELVNTYEKLDLQCQEMEEKISTLGLEQDIVDEYLDLARQMAYYEVTK